METIHEIDAIKVEKDKAMRRYRTFRKIVNIVRTLEIFLAITFISFSISWTSSYISTMLHFSGDFLRLLSSLLFSPLFVFLIGNVIVITLFANSSSSSDHAEQISSDNSGDFLPENADGDVNAVVEFPATEVAVVEKAVEKVYRRSQSTAIVAVAKAEEAAEKKELRRSTTVPRRKIGSDDVAAKVTAAKTRRSCEKEELSNEEFNKKVVEFIEKQMRFLSEESKILVLSN